MFTPSSKKRTEYQLFLPVACVLRFAESDDIPDDIREEQAVALGKYKKEADKQKAKAELKLDDVDICDADKQQEIFRQQTQNYYSSSEKIADSEWENQKHEDGDVQSGRPIDNLVKTFPSSGKSN